MTAPDVVTFGEAMALFQPLHEGPLAHAALFTRTLAGAELNFAVALARLGYGVRWISRLGSDPFGDAVAKTLTGEGVDTACVTRDARAPTGVFFREYRGEEPFSHYYRALSAASLLSAQDVRPGWFAGARWLFVTGITPALSPSCREATFAAVRLARELGLLIAFDPNLRRKLWPEEVARATLLELASLCDVLLPGREEAEFLLGPGTPEAHARALLALGPRLVALKLGAGGALGVTADLCLHVPALPVARVIDPIGAGDAFAAGLLSRLLDEQTEFPLSEPVLSGALARANALGALATQVRGDWEGLPTRDELERALSGQAEVTR